MLLVNTINICILIQRTNAKTKQSIDINLPPPTFNKYYHSISLKNIHEQIQ